MHVCIPDTLWTSLLNFIHFLIDAFEKNVSTDPEDDGGFFSALFFVDFVGLSFSLPSCCFVCMSAGDGDDPIDADFVLASAGVVSVGVDEVLEPSSIPTWPGR